MQYRELGRTGFKVSEIGFGGYGIGGHEWAHQREGDSRGALARAFEAGVNFFDTALIYGYGTSERLIGDFIRVAGKREEIFVASKIHPMNWTIPPERDVTLDQVFPPHHIKQAVNESLRNLRLEHIDLIQLHTWADQFTDDLAWYETLSALRNVGKVKHIGICVGSHAPESALRIVASKKIDTIAVHYNIFEQRPAQALFAAAREAGVGVIVRSPLEESALTGKLTEDQRFPEGDFRNVYFAGDRLEKTVDRVERLRPILEDAAGTMAQGALRFALSNPDVSTVLAGMRTPQQAAENVRASDAGPLPADVLEDLAGFAWERSHTSW